MSTSGRLEEHVSPIADDVRRGLASIPKTLPPRLLYDAEGSTLFERITELPEYYLTRTERAILETHADAIARQAGRGLTLIELGAGTASKTQILIRALLRRQERLVFYPVDVSPAALAIAGGLAANLPGLQVRPLVSDYTRGLGFTSLIQGRKLVLFIGSSIGNYLPAEARAILGRITHALAPGDALLLGTDMVRDPAVLLPAYDDSQGLTARFNQNVLHRINRELGGRFDVAEFRHVALWNAAKSRIEMHLESRRPQVVAITALRLQAAFAAGERIHTENSYKFTVPMVRGILEPAGFALERTFSDERRAFGLHLARLAASR